MDYYTDVNYKIGFIISEFLPTKKIVLTSLKKLDPNKTIIYKVPVYSPQKKSNNKLLFRIFKETNIRYICFKIFDTLFVRFYRTITFRRIDHYAKALGIAVKSLGTEIDQINDEILKDDIDILVLSTNQIVPQSTLEAPKFLAINIHLAKLPEYGGLFNQFWMMLNNETKGYACVHIASKNLDAGKVLLEDFISVVKSESLLSLYIRTAELAGNLLCEFLMNLQDYLNVDLNEEKNPTIRGLPSSKDMKVFKKKSLKLVRFSDFYKLEIF